MTQTRKTIHTPAEPQAIGSYSQAVRVGDTVYLSGQIPLDPATMQLVAGDIHAEIRRVFDNLTAVAAAAGATPAAPRTSPARWRASVAWMHCDCCSPS